MTWVFSFYWRLRWVVEEWSREGRDAADDRRTRRLRAQSEA